MQQTTTAIKPIKKGKTYNQGGTLPFPREQLRQELLELAGFNKEKQTSLLDLTLKELRKALKAKKLIVVTNKGVVTEKIKEVDWAARMAAIKQSMDLLDVVRGKNEGEHAAQTKLVINMPDWDKPPQPQVEVINTDYKVIEEKEETKNEICVDSMAAGE